MAKDRKMNTYVITSISGGYEPEIEGTQIICAENENEAVTILQAICKWESANLIIVELTGVCTPTYVHNYQGISPRSYYFDESECTKLGEEYFKALD